MQNEAEQILELKKEISILEEQLAEMKNPESNPLSDILQKMISGAPKMYSDCNLSDWPDYARNLAKIQELATVSLSADTYTTAEEICLSYGDLYPGIPVRLVVRCTGLIPHDNGTILCISDPYRSLQTNPIHVMTETASGWIGKLIWINAIMIPTDINSPLTVTRVRTLKLT